MFEHLDYVYMPSRDVAADVTYFTEVLGGSLVFAIDGMGTRVAMVALTEESPRILLAGHLDGDRPVLVYRVDDLTTAMADLKSRGWTAGSHAGDPARPGLLVHRSGRSAAGHLRAVAAGRRGELRRAARLLTSSRDRSLPTVRVSAGIWISRSPKRKLHGPRRVEGAGRRARQPAKAGGGLHGHGGSSCVSEAGTGNQLRDRG